MYDESCKKSFDKWSAVQKIAFHMEAIKEHDFKDDLYT